MLPKAQLVNFKDPDYITQDELSIRYQHLTDLLHKFQRRWQQDYVIGLRERTLKMQRHSNYRPAVGDLVLLIKDHVPRDQYPLARIVAVFPGADGLIRSVRVRTPQGEYERALNKLIYLEINLLDIPDAVEQPPPLPVESDVAEEGVEEPLEFPALPAPELPNAEVADFPSTPAARQEDELEESTDVALPHVGESDVAGHAPSPVADSSDERSSSPPAPADPESHAPLGNLELSVRPRRSAATAQRRRLQELLDEGAIS